MSHSYIAMNAIHAAFLKEKVNVASTPISTNSYMIGCFGKKKILVWGGMCMCTHHKVLNCH